MMDQGPFSWIVDPLSRAGLIPLPNGFKATVYIAIVIFKILLLIVKTKQVDTFL